MGWSVLGSVQHGRNRIVKTSLHFGRFSRAVCHHPQIHAYILLGFERLRTQHRQHARHAHFFAIFAVGKTRLKNATFKSRRRSSRGTCTLYKRLRVSNHFHTLYLICNENLTPTSYTFSEFLSANFRENSENFHDFDENALEPLFKIDIDEGEGGKIMANWTFLTCFTDRSIAPMFSWIFPTPKRINP